MSPQSLSEFCAMVFRYMLGVSTLFLALVFLSTPAFAEDSQAKCLASVRRSTALLKQVHASYKTALKSYARDAHLSTLQSQERRLLRLRDMLNGKRLCAIEKAPVCLDYFQQEATKVRDILRSPKQDVRDVAWPVEAKLFTLREVLKCDASAVAFKVETDRGAKASRTVVRMSPVTDEGAREQAGEEITLKVRLVCQRKTVSGYEDIAECDGADMREDDRFKVGFQVQQAAFIYVLMFNGRKQFQMLYPNASAKLESNQAQARVDYYLPGEEWWLLDDVGGLQEHIQVVVSEHKLPVLEQWRGVRVPPNNGEEFPDFINIIRGQLEGVLHRGYEVPEPTPMAMPLKGGKGNVRTMTYEVTSAGVVVFEFTLNHVN